MREKHEIAVDKQCRTSTESISLSPEGNPGLGSGPVWWLPYIAEHPRACFLSHTASQGHIVGQDGSWSSCHHEHTVRWGRKSRRTKREPFPAERAPPKHHVSPGPFHCCLFVGQNLVTWPHVAKRGAGKPGLASGRRWPG